MFARSGATTGKSFLVKAVTEAVFASYLIRIHPIEEVLPEYLYEFFQSPVYWKQVLEETKGSALPNMNGQKLSNVMVPLPTNKDKQRHIVDYLIELRDKYDQITKLYSERENMRVILSERIINENFSRSKVSHD